MIGLMSGAIAVFGYGSNMLTARMLMRAPAARVLGPACLERFALRWNKRSKDGSGKCSIEETGRREDFVWGVLYELNSADKKRLDAFEGLGRGYGERSVGVLTNGKMIRVRLLCDLSRSERAAIRLVSGACYRGCTRAPFAGRIHPVARRSPDD